MGSLYAMWVTACLGVVVVVVVSALVAEVKAEIRYMRTRERLAREARIRQEQRRRLY